MSKRPAFDLAALTSEAAAPMQEAAQRAPRPAPPTLAAVAANSAPKTEPLKVVPASTQGDTPTANLQGLSFKVSPAFRKRFRQRAVDADLKLNDLLFAALEAWEQKQGLKR